MRIAIIDLGTNSVRFDVHEIISARRIRQLHREKLMIRLGQGVFLGGRLDSDAIHRTLQAFSSFKLVAKKLQVQKIVAFGTSVLREASDGPKLLDQIRRRSGIEVRVISGVEEARLISLGILSHQGFGSKPVALVDIGGGSTEVSFCRGKKTISALSLPLGSARLQQVFLLKSPPRPESVAQLRKHIRGLIAAETVDASWKKTGAVVGSSGTIRAIMKLLKSGGATYKALQKLNEKMVAMTTSELLATAGMEAKRVDMILAGSLLLEEIMRATRATKLLVTDYTLRDGILEEELNLYRKHARSRIVLHLSDLYDKAKNFGLDEKVLTRSVLLAENLFDRLKPVHQMSSSWRIYLTAAMIFRNCGESVSMIRSGIHSYYIVKNFDLPAIEPWEAELIAQLCFYCEGGKIEPGLLPFRKEKDRYVAFVKLLALLRVADGLDSGPQTHVKMDRVVLTRQSVQIAISGRNLTDLEAIRVDRKKELFEQVFRRKLKVVAPFKRLRF